MKKFKIFFLGLAVALFLLILKFEIKPPNFSFGFGENSKLKKEIMQKNEEIAELKSLKAENQNLTVEISFLKEEKLSDLSVKRIDAEVVGFSYEGDKRLMVLAKGKNSGIDENCFVARKNNFLGIVEITKDKTAFVNTLISPDFDSEGEILQVNAKGVIKSKLDGIFVEDMVSETPIEKGMSVTTLKSENMPIPFFIGEVEKIFKKENSPVYSAEIKTFIKFEDLDFVSVYCKI